MSQKTIIDIFLNILTEIEKWGLSSMWFGGGKSYCKVPFEHTPSKTLLQESSVIFLQESLFGWIFSSTQSVSFTVCVLVRWK